MGPALKALADRALQDVSRSLMIAFSAVILALLAAAIALTVVNVRKRWYAVDLAAIEAELAGQPPSAARHRHAPEKARGRRMVPAHPAPAAPSRTAPAPKAPAACWRTATRQRHPLGREPDRCVPGHHRRLAAGRGASQADPFTAEQVTVIKNPGKEEHGGHHQGRCKIEHYKASGEIGEGQPAWPTKMKGATMVYVPEAGVSASGPAPPQLTRQPLRQRLAHLLRRHRQARPQLLGEMLACGPALAPTLRGPAWSHWQIALG